jgi:hypothetical protein
MEKENLKLTNTISSLITDDLKKNTKHESLEHAAQILRNVIKLYVFVIFCVISVGCCWFVSVIPWFIFCPRLLFFYNPSRAMAIS